MNRSQLLLRLLFKAAWVRKDRAFTALVSVAVVATIATAALTIYSDLEGKLSREFRGFGANVIVTENFRRFDSASELAEFSKIVGAAWRSCARCLCHRDKLQRGCEDRRRRRGSRKAAQAKHLVVLCSSGKFRAAALVGCACGGSSFAWQAVGNRLRPRHLFVRSRRRQFSIPAPTTTAASIFRLDDFLRLTGVQPNTALVRIEGKPQDIQAAIASLSAALPNAEVKPVRQITQAQTAVVGKTRSVVLASSAVVVILIMLCMVATFTGSVLERRKDFAVMKALGASDRAVNFLFASESALLALTGSIAGYILGCGIAFWIGKANFDAAILPQPLLLFPVLLGSVVLALIASTAPLRLLQQIQPAGILRGE